MKHKIQAIYWADAHSSTWRRPDEKVKDEGMPVVSIGMVIADNNKAVTLAGGYWSNGDYGDTITIPKGMILRRRNIALLTVEDDKRKGTAER